MHRRTFLSGASAAALLSTNASAAETARRTFRILRDGDDIGRHVLSASLGPDGFEMAIDIDIRVKILGITAYRYTLQNRERWQGGRIASVETVVNDDGDDYSARIRRDGDRLIVDGTSHSGAVPLDAVTTSYYAPPFIQRRPWLSTQSGKPLEVAIAPDGDNWFKVSGELETRLGYDSRGEWIACEFDAGGEAGRYEVIEDTGAIAALWARA